MKPEIRRYIIELNKDYIKNKVGEAIDKLCEELKKCYSQIDELKLDVEKANKQRVKFARAYCEEIGIIISQKEYKDPLDEIFVESHFKRKSSEKRGKK